MLSNSSVTLLYNFLKFIKQGLLDLVISVYRRWIQKTIKGNFSDKKQNKKLFKVMKVKGNTSAADFQINLGHNFIS